MTTIRQLAKSVRDAADMLAMPCPNTERALDEAATHLLSLAAADENMPVIGSKVTERGLERVVLQSDAHAAVLAATAPLQAENTRLHEDYRIQNDCIVRLQAEVERLRTALVETRAALGRENEREGAICDTLWQSDFTTLFDYIDASIQGATDAQR
jgi:hypothetical protein